MKLKEVLKNLCAKLSMLEIYLKPLPINSSFLINVVTNYAASVIFTESFKYYDFSWIIDKKIKKIKNGLLLPIYSFKTNYFVLQLFVVKNKHKILNK
jgi:hypothetical protein